MRPINRPSKPYTRQQIAEAIWNHFIVEKNPKCVDGRYCIYGKTGCAVGCLLTQEDADYIDGINKTLSIFLWDDVLSAKELREIYFNEEDINFLGACQNWHDNSMDSLRLKELFDSYDLDTSKMIV